MMRSITEREVQAIWYDEKLRPEQLVTRKGSVVKVISPGEWNLEPGPDFRNAVLEIGRERRRLTGDVEIHLAPRDWDIHRHGCDPNYRNVIAHVTWSCGPIPSTLPAGAVSIWLGRFVVHNPAFSPDQIDLDAYPFARLPLEDRPCSGKYSGDPDAVRELLLSAGRKRLRMKARRLIGRLCENSYALGVGRSLSVREEARLQIYYEEAMTALGYKKNAAAFRRVANRVRFGVLPRSRAAAETALAVAGSFEIWDRTSGRPANSPERRLRQAAKLLTETAFMDFCDSTDFSKDACRGMIDEMCGKNRPEPGLGRGRAAALLANVVVPFALAENRLQTPLTWLPPEDLSSPVRQAAFRLLGRDHNPTVFYAANGLLIQGLIHLYQDCCRNHYPDCTSCPTLN